MIVVVNTKFARRLGAIRRLTDGNIRSCHKPCREIFTLRCGGMRSEVFEIKIRPILKIPEDITAIIARNSQVDADPEIRPM